MASISSSPCEDVVGKRKGPFHCAEQRPADRTLRRDDPCNRAAIACQLDRLPSLGAPDQFSELGLGFGYGNLHHTPHL